MDNTEYVLLHTINKLDVPVNVQKIFFELKDHPNYPTLLALSDVLNNWKINNLAFKLDFEQLNTVPLPFVAHLSTNNKEYVLVSKISKTHVTLSNEVYKDTLMPLVQFKDAYNGTILMIDQKAVKKLKKNKDGTGGVREKSNNPFGTAPLTQKVTYLDIGASYGLPFKWEQYVADDLFDLILVEPDEFQALAVGKMYPKATLIKHALGNQNGQVTINITSAQSCSSVLEPDTELLSRFPIHGAFNVVYKTQTDIYRFEDLVTRYNLNHPQFIKIDVQGFEYAVLEGFGSILDDVLCIELETHLVPIYKGEKALHQMNDFLNSKGFYLRHLDNVGAFEGEALEFDAYFIKRDEHLKTDAQKQLIKLWENINQLPEPKRFAG